MDNNQINKMQTIIREDGKWSAHNICLGGDTYTIKNKIVNDEYKLQRVIQNISDLTNKDFSELRILDLACLEGLFGIECALQGASVTFLDAREINLRKVRFVCESLELDKVAIVKGDVRTISKDELGEFDVILCFGIFYHLDKDDLYPFVEKMFDMASSMVFFDTHIAYSHKESFTAGGNEYYGYSYQEHRPDTDRDEIEKDLWRSIDNPKSFIMEKVSLLRMLGDTGFSSVLESVLPADITKDRYRVSLIALKGTHIQIKTTPFLNGDNHQKIPVISIPDEIKQSLKKAKGDLIYNLKLKSPQFIRTFYKKYIKRP